MYKILIIEDDLAIANSIKKYMQSWGFETETIYDFKEIMSSFTDYKPHLILLDISLPYFNGYYWCSEIRKVSNVPIIFISSASDHMNIVMAMSMGGDDFITKPFELDVLTAKIQALLRRTYDFGNVSHVLEYNGIQLNISNLTLEYNGQKIELSKNENKILQILFENKGKVVSRDSIMVKLWETDHYIDDNTLTVNITRLRKRLQEVGLSGFNCDQKRHRIYGGIV